MSSAAVVIDALRVNSYPTIDFCTEKCGLLLHLLHVFKCTPDYFFIMEAILNSMNPDQTRASDFFQDWWAKVTHGAKMVGHFMK